MRTRTAPGGTFRLVLDPGTYVVTARAGMHCTQVDVTARANRTSRVVIGCDTGIR